MGAFSDLVAKLNELNSDNTTLVKRIIRGELVPIETLEKSKLPLRAIVQAYNRRADIAEEKVRQMRRQIRHYNMPMATNPDLENALVSIKNVFINTDALYQRKVERLQNTINELRKEKEQHGH